MLEGSLGAGKTTLVKGIARALSIEEEITSPSFTLIAEYAGFVEAEAVTLFHIDLYRIDQLQESEELGLEEIWAGPGISVVEWGERAGSLLPAHCFFVRIRLEENGERVISLENCE